MMDKIMSARLDEAVLDIINQISQNKRVSKKKVIEGAIRLYWQEIMAENEQQVFKNSFAAWKRKESAEITVKKVKQAFKKNMGRNHQGL
jgi:hypothetical protein